MKFGEKPKEEGGQMEMNIGHFFKKESGKFADLLSDSEVVELTALVKYKKDVDAQNKLVEHNIRLLCMVANKFKEQYNTVVDFNDLVNEGVFGIITAAEKYDPEKGMKFSTYAVWWIEQKMRRSLYNNRHIIRRPERDLAAEDRLARHSAIFLQKNCRYPTNKELVKLADMDIERVDEVLKGRTKIVYLEDSRLESDKDGEALTFCDVIEDCSSCPIDEIIWSGEEAREKLKAICAEVRNVLSLLEFFKKRDKTVFKLRYGFYSSFEVETLEFVGKKYFMTKEGARAILDNMWQVIEAKTSVNHNIFCDRLIYVRALRDVGINVKRFIQV